MEKTNKEKLFKVFRKALDTYKKNKNRVQIDELSEEDFVNHYMKDPFFQARVDVELEKALPKMNSTLSSGSSSEPS